MAPTALISRSLRLASADLRSRRLQAVQPSSSPSNTLPRSWLGHTYGTHPRRAPPPTRQPRHGLRGQVHDIAPAVSQLAVRVHAPTHHCAPCSSAHRCAGTHRPPLPLHSQVRSPQPAPSGRSSFHPRVGRSRSDPAAEPAVTAQRAGVVTAAETATTRLDRPSTPLARAGTPRPWRPQLAVVVISPAPDAPSTRQDRNWWYCPVTTATAPLVSRSLSPASIGWSLSRPRVGHCGWLPSTAQPRRSSTAQVCILPAATAAMPP